MDGYCPITLLKNDIWKKGDPQFGVIHRGRVYLFSGGKERDQFYANPDDFSPVLAGIDLPDMDGAECFQRVREIHEYLPVILMTGFGYDPHHSIVRASQEGLQGVLFKPFQIEQLVEQVRKTFESAPAKK